jgi:hypothetical protein
MKSKFIAQYLMTENKYRVNGQIIIACNNINKVDVVFITPDCAYLPDLCRVKKKEEESLQRLIFNFAFFNDS